MPLPRLVIQREVSEIDRIPLRRLRDRGLPSASAYRGSGRRLTLELRDARGATTFLWFCRSFVRLADYERLAHEVDATGEGIAAALFAEHPHVFCVLAFWNGDPAGFAVWLYNFSTFRGRHGIWLEDLFVEPEPPRPRHRQGTF